MFKKVLIANRGEIAVRIQRTLRTMGVTGVAVFAENERGAPHVAMAPDAVSLGNGPLSNTYLSIPALLQAARATGCGALHPGYGFLSESPAFSRACGDAGITFIGPPPEAMERLGNKASAKGAAKQAGVPTVPSAVLEDDASGLARAAEAIGLPLLIKALAGGGGRGQRLVTADADLAAHAEAAVREAKAAFGDGRLLLERWVPEARHIEVQVLADGTGETIHLFERDCSVQRRRQKLIEECPAPGLSQDLRRRLHQAAVDVCRAAGYRNAGTAEFLVSPDGAFYFLELNARLQVEHPVTEAVTGLDLVREQVLIAAGEPLSAGTRSAAVRGHAIEARICAEDPYGGFAPSSGRLVWWRPPTGPGVRVDSGVQERQQVTSDYDSLLAKVIAHGQDREESRRRLVIALRELAALGVATTAPFLANVLDHRDFRAGRTHTRWLETTEGLHGPSDTERDLAPIAAALAAGRGGPLPGGRRPAGDGLGRPPMRVGHRPEEGGPWHSAGTWSNT